MSLRSRLFLAILLVNLGVLVLVSWSVWSLRRQWEEDNSEVFSRILQLGVVSYAYSEDPFYSGGSIAHLMNPQLREQLRSTFSDLMVINGRSPTAAGSVDLNPLGASHRDGEEFPLDDVRAGIRSAMADREYKLAGDGYCLPLIGRGDLGEEVVIGGVWCRPLVEPAPAIPFTIFAVPVLSATLLIGLLAYWYLGRKVVRPLDELSAAAREVGSGRAAVRVPKSAVPGELEVVIDSFNTMAEEIEGHRSELLRAVQRATEEAKRQERAMIQSGRLASMGTLAAGIAHEINNPIGGMLNAVLSLDRGEGLTERERVYLGLIKDGLQRVSRIVRRVLDFSPRSVEAVPFDFGSALESARGLVDHRLRGARVELRLELEEGLPQLFGDPHEFQQVLLNLMINSIDVLEPQEGERWIEVRARRSGDRVEIVVRDNGPGMEPEQLDRVFDPFYSAKGRPDASGLGMFISYAILRNLGGTVDLWSQPGEGFVVTLDLPTAPGKESAEPV